MSEKKISKVIRGDIFQAHQTADEIIGNAEETAKTILEKVRNQTGSIRKQAYTDGWLAGTGRIAGLLEEAHRYRYRMESNLVSDMTRIIIAVCRKIIMRHIETEPSVIKEMILEHLKLVRRQRSIVIGLNPQDYQAIRDDIAEIASSTLYPEEITFKVEKGIEIGGCRISSPIGTIVTDIDTQLRIIAGIINPAVDPEEEEVIG